MLALKRIASIAAAIAMAIGAVVIGTPAASADTVLMKYRCGNAIGGGWDFNWYITITAPANATPGQTVTLNISAESPTPSSQPVAAGVTFAYLDVRLGGASSGIVYSTRMSNPDIPAGSPLRYVGATAQATLANAGDVTYKPDKFAYGVTGAGVWCNARPGFVTPVAATTRVA